MCGALLDDWGNGDSADLFLTLGNFGFSSMRSWCCSMSWVWNIRTELCRIASGK